MATLPSGTVTFLFTDIEGSTVRWELDPHGMSDALIEHDVLLRSTIEANGGVVFSTGGDGFAAAFTDAASALRAAVEAQDLVELPVRMGLHTGTAVERDGDYFGRTLNRAARIMSAGNGGQIVLSDVTAALVRDDADVVDLGEHRLAGVDRLLRLWQVGERQFPPLRTSIVVTGNLPVRLDSFVGRTEELDLLSDLVRTRRLVTVVGVGGMGKTRLVIEACHRECHVDDGVWFVDLSVARSDSAVAEEVALLFGLQAAPGRSVEDRLIEHLEARTALVVFDNCEHVMRRAAGLIDRLLQACPALKVVATSREALMIRGEHVMALGPLPMDTHSGDDSVADAVALFVDRLTAEGGPSNIDDDERAVVLEICRQLDGMPLAIELAAARARTLGTSGVLARLGERLDLLSGGWRTSAGRQQTMSATLDWSYALLDEREQVLFDRLAVFVGWFTLEDAVAVAGHSPLAELDVLDAISGLVDKSMCTVDLGVTPTRYRYLETMRSYGREHLSRSENLAECRDRHAAHLAASARRIREALVGPGELEAARHAERLIADLRAAWGWAVHRHLDDVIDDVAALAGVIAVRGSYEMSGWCYDLRDVLRDRPRVQAAACGHALSSRGDLVEARRLGERMIETGGDLVPVAWTHLGFVEFNEGHFDQAVECMMRAYTIAGSGTDELYRHALDSTSLAMILAATGRDATELVQESLDRAQAARWPTALALAHYTAGLAIINTDPVASLEALNRAVDIAVQVGSRGAEAIARTVATHLQKTLLPRAELALALTRLLRHLQLSGDASGTALLAFSEVIELLNEAGRLRTAALICGWLDGRSGRSMDSLGEHEAAVAAVRHSLGDQWDVLVRQGRTKTTNQVFDMACDELDTID